MGYIHSIEKFGTVDGPNVRFVVFFQGCPMRCLYCHNPDTWNISNGKEISVDEILNLYKRNQSFYANGGITVTGGEPMFQMDFLLELFTKAKEMGIHTCLDTSGILFTDDNKMKQLMNVTDLVLLDIKHIDDKKHQELTGHSNENILAFAKYLDLINKPVWIRHVVVPEITFIEEDLIKLREFINALSNVKKVEVLPYHTLGKNKYEKLGLAYPLEGIRQLSDDELKIAEKILCL